MKRIILLIAICLFVWSGNSYSAENGIIKVVVLGSSTAAGAGVQNSANAWVNQYRQYVQSFNASSDVINLAVGGYTTYQLMPSDYTPPTGKPTPSAGHNITEALDQNPDAIIINLPSNDAANNFTVEEQLSNYDLMLEKANEQNVPVWIATTQPRNFSSSSQMQIQLDMRDSTYSRFGDKAIDFWTGIATAEGTIEPIFDSGDGVHLNDSAHTVLKDRVVEANILAYSRIDNDIDTILLDFGSNLSDAPWNNLDEATGDTIQSMVNSLNQRTGISVWVHDPFTGVNTSGATSPDASINFPGSATSDSFFGNVGDHSGIIEPTGGITLSDLNRNSLYSFTIFSARDGVTDNRETEYTFIGKEEQSVYLDAANNTANVVTLEDVSPDLNGTIIINVGPGPNNNNSKNYYYLGAIQIIAEKQEIVYDTDGTINIDLGSNLSSGAWNNLTMAVGGEVINDLVNAEGNSTGFSLWIHDAFTGVNLSGTTSPDESLEIDPNASSDSFFGSTGAHSGIIEPTAGITLASLTLDAEYSITFFASREGVTDNRETQYTVTGATVETVYLDAANNTSNTITVEKMKPASDGTIVIDISPGPNNTNSVHYYYLGALKVEYGPGSTNAFELEEMSKNFSTKIYPNPFSNNVRFDYMLSEPGEFNIKIYNLKGQVENVLTKKHEAAGSYNIEWDGTNQHGMKSKAGLYLCQISLVTANKIHTSTQKLMIK